MISLTINNNEENRLVTVADVVWTSGIFLEFLQSFNSFQLILVDCVKYYNF
jgi:hypothetical protein